MRIAPGMVLSIGLSVASSVIAAPSSASITFHNQTDKNITEELFAYSCGISQQPERLVILRPGVTVITFASSDYGALHYCQVGITIAPFLERRSATLEGTVEGREGVVTAFNPDMRISYQIPDFSIHLQAVDSANLEVEILPNS